MSMAAFPPVLKGVRVLDLTHVVSGPYATLYLAMMGAEIIKIERPASKGDSMRATGPFVGNYSARFATLNHNKSSIVLDLSTAEGKDIFLKLVEKSDIVVDNFRPGVLDRLGIGYDKMSAANPKIVYGNISGFGSWGPYRDLPAYDVISQAMSGIMWLNGSPEYPPVKVGTSIGDMIAGINLALGVTAALYQAQVTGHGRAVEVSLVDALISTLTMENIGYLVNGTMPERLGNHYREWCPCGVFKASDGYYVLAVGTEAHFKSLAVDVLKMPELVNDPRFGSQDDRVAHRSEICGILDRWAEKLTVAEICVLLRGAGVPCAAVSDISQIANDEHIAGARGMFPKVPQPQVGELTVTDIPLRFIDTESVPMAAAPEKGVNTAELLKAILGMTDADIDKLSADNVITL